MAQNIQLKRSALPGKVPDTGSLNLGEIAINTYDGKLYFKKSGSLQSIESIVTTNSINTGSITLTQTGSFGELVITQDVNIQRDLYVTNDIIGNGDIDVLGNITGSNLLIKGTLTAQSYIVSSSVVNMTTQFASGSTIFGNTSDDTHQFTGSVNITGSGYINSNIIITSADTGSFGASGGSYPVSGVDYDTDLVTVQDFNSESGQFLIDYLYEVPVGTQVGLKGFLGNTSGSTLVVPANDYIAFVIDDVQVARITADGFEGVNFPPNVVSGSSQLTSSYDTRYVLSGSITQTTWDNIASKPSGIVSSSVQVLGGTNIISGSSQITPLLPSGIVSGSAQLPSGIVSGSAQTIANLPTGTVSGSIQVLGGTGIISSSAQLENATITNLTITNLTTVNETASVLFSSGSNIFGDFGNDTHSFTGSVQVSGSQTIVGTLTATTLNGTINATNGVVSGSSQITYTSISSIPSGIVSGSSQILGGSGIVSGSSQVTASLDIRYSLSGSSGAVLDSRSRYLSQSSAATTWSFTHNIGSDHPMVTVYGSNNEIIQPEYVKTLSSNQTEIGFGTPVSGIAVASLGSLTEVTGRTIRQDFTASVSWSFVHNVGDKYVMVQAFDSADQMILPAEIRLASTTSSILTFPEAVSGYALATIGGDLPSISSSYEGYTLQVQSGLPTWTPIVSASVSNAVTASYILPSGLPIGVISGSSQVTYTSVSSIPAGIVSGSSQIVSILSSLNTYTASVSTGSLATTGSNSFIGNQNISGTVYLTGSLIPSGNFVYDLGSETNSFRDLFISTGSIRFHNPDGTEQGRITVDARSGDISLLKTAGLTNEQKATISQGNINPTFLSAISASNLFVQTKIVMPAGGTVNGINLTAFSSSVSNTILNQNSATSSYETKGSGIVSGSSQITFSGISSLPTLVSGSSQITYASISSIPSGIVSSSTQTITNLPTGTVSGSSQILGGSGLVSGSSQVNLASVTGNSTSNVSEGTNLYYTDARVKTKLDAETVVSGSSQVVGILSALNTFSASASSSIDSIQNYTSSLRAAFTASGANVTFSGNVTIPGNLTIAGTQTIVNSTTIQLGDNIIELNGNGVANGGLLVKDPTAPNTVSGSLLWDSTNDYWKAGALGNESKLLRAEGDSIVSGSSQVNFTQLSGISNGIVSGSTQTIANLPTGTVSGSSQVVSILSSLNTYTGSNDTTNTAQSARLTTLESVTGSYETKGRSIVSGSSQITYANISSIPGGIVSGSSQITYTGISSIPGGIVSGSSQTIANLPTGVVSGSSQITYANISSIPGGIVSGSSQIDVMSTTNIAKLATTGSNTFRGNQIISGSLNIFSDGGTNPVLAIRQTNAATQGYDFETEDVSVGRLDLYGKTSGGRVQMMTWIKANGRVGIGDIAPKTKLQVTPVSNAEAPTLGTANGVATFTSANSNYGLQFNTTSDGSFHIQSQRFDNIATAYNLILNYAGGNIGIGGNTSLGCSLDISSRTDAIALPKGTTGQRPTAASGMIRYNTTNSKPEYYNGSAWVTVGASGDGSSYSNAASSAKSIKAIVGNPSSGVYWLQVANVNSGNPFQCYCDFTMDGGIGYAIIFNQYFTGAETGPSHANFAASTISTAGFDTEYQISPTAMVTNYGLTKLAVFARTGGSSSNGITGATYYNWVSFTGPTTTQFNNIFTNGYNSNQFTGTFNSSDGNTGTAYFPNSHGNTGGVTQITTNGGTVNNYTLYEYNANGGTDPNHFWMVLNGRDGDTYWVVNTRYGSNSGNVMYNRYGGVAIY